MATERREFARALRKRPTRAEDILWERLRGSRFHGAKFRRQVPFDRYVVDFVTPRNSWSRSTASSTNGSRTTTPGGRKFWSAWASTSFASPTPKCATISTRRSREFARRCVCHLIDAPVPSPLPLSRRERGSRVPPVRERRRAFGNAWAAPMRQGIAMAFAAQTPPTWPRLAIGTAWCHRLACALRLKALICSNALFTGGSCTVCGMIGSSSPLSADRSKSFSPICQASRM
jgi:Protein of unknown function (DUF559)